jgi:hypothetical protein
VRSSAIVDPLVDPLSLLVNAYYVPRNQSALQAYSDTNSVEQLSRKDTTVFEFIGDLTYSSYINGA